jgi:hypothetical protein
MGEPSAFAMAAGVKKMPTPINSPTTKAVAVPSPSCRWSSLWEAKVFTSETGPPFRSEGRCVQKIFRATVKLGAVLMM